MENTTLTVTANGLGTANTGYYWPDGYWPYTAPQISYYPWTSTVYPVDCIGDIHVFPCPHCDKCKCGKAEVKREGKRKK